MARSTIEVPRAIGLKAFFSSPLTIPGSQNANSSVIRPCTYAVRSVGSHAGRCSPSPGLHRYSRESRPAPAAVLRAAGYSGGGIYLGARLLGLGQDAGRLLLGAGDVGRAATTRATVDASLLGLGRRTIPLPSRLLGARSRLLRRHRLWLRLWRRIAGGRWDNGHFFYNRSVNNIENVRITNVYNQTVVVNNRINNVSFNGGNGGITARPTPQQEALSRERHVEATPVQRQHIEAASKDRALFSKQNHGEPAVAATPRAGVFQGAGVSHGSRTPGAARPNGEPNGAERPGAAVNRPMAGEKPAPIEPPREAQPRPNERVAPVEEQRRPAQEPPRAEEPRRPAQEPTRVEEPRRPEPPRVEQPRGPAQEPPRVEEQRRPAQEPPRANEMRPAAPRMPERPAAAPARPEEKKRE